MRVKSWLTVACSIALLIACRGDHVLAPTSPSLSIVAGGGDNQSGVVGKTLPLPLIVQVTGVSGPVNGQALNFVVTSGGGSVFAGVVHTGTPNTGPAINLSGVGQNTWTLGPTVGPQTVEARLVDSKSGRTLTQATFRATAVAGTARALKVARGDKQIAEAGNPVQLAPSVLVTDQTGNPLPNIAVTFQVARGLGTITGPTQIATGADGIATVAGWSLGATAGPNTLTASSVGLSGSPVTFSATGVAGAATTLATVSGDGQHVVRGTALPLSAIIQVSDANGNGVAGAAVTFTVTTGGGTMDGITSVSTLTNLSGRASVGWSVGSLPGPNTLRATSLGLTGSPVTFTATGYTPLYVANQNTPSITVYEAELGGNSTPVRTISGANTTLVLPASMTRDAAGQLYVTNYVTGGGILIFAAGADGNVAPIRSIRGPNTGLSKAFGLTLDASGQIYVFDYDTRRISVFASDATGDAIPVRVIGGANTGLAGVPALRVAPNGELYAADQDGNNIKVFAAGASGDVAPVRKIGGPGPSTLLSAPGALEFDPTGNGQLYVTNFHGASITVYAAGADGDATPVRTIAGSSTGLLFPTGLRFDSAGLLYVSNYIANSVMVYAPGATGDAAPVRTFIGGNTGLNRPGWLTF